MRRYLMVVLLLLVLPVCAFQCTPEQREKGASVAGGAADVLGKVAPIVGPWAPIVAMVSVLLNCVAAVVAPREAIRNARLKKAIRETAARIDELKLREQAAGLDEKSTIADAAGVVLKELDKLKDIAPDKIKKFLNLFDAVRKEAA